MRIQGVNVRRRVVVRLSAVAVLASGLWALRALVTGGTEPHDALGLPIAVAALALTVWTTAQPPSADPRSVAATLARRVASAEQEERLRLVGDIHVLDPSCTLTTGSGSASTERPATVASVRELLLAEGNQRLLITGAPGAGKTVCALGLIISLLRDRAEGQPVPVRFPLAEYDPHRRLADWIAVRLTEDYDLPPRHARLIVEERLVLPVLDGLDEMDAVTAPDDRRPRARAAVAAFDRYLVRGEPGPLVVTCRTGDFPAAARLTTTALVRLEPLPADSVREFLLTHGTPDAWEPVLTLLHDDPAGPLAQALTTPWRVTQVVAAYPGGVGSARLAAFTEDAEGLDAHLLDGYVRRAAEGAPGTEAPYDPDQVRRWLTRLARHLQRDGGTHSDLRPHELWPMGGRLLVRCVDAACVVALLALAALWRRHHPGFNRYSAPYPFAGALLDAGMLAMVSVIVVRTALDRSPPLLTIPLRRLRSARVLRRIGVGLLPVTVAGLIAVPLLGSALQPVLDHFGYEANLDAFLDVGLDLDRAEATRLCLIVLPLLWLTALPGAIRRAASHQAGDHALSPHSAIRTDLAAGLTAGVLVALLLLFPYGSYLRIPVAAPLCVWLPVGHAMGPVYVSVLGLLYGLAFCGASGRRYLAFLLCMSGRLPWRLGRFLDWAHQAGLLRVTGGSYQFRHRELQQWLSNHPPPDPLQP
ncbi:NACHT domain-containing protein [Streptomyces sp. SAS_270]|uniref:NACHT domain-containing protein n=1 Tax=Streptomyces sp. SAS_270 TaxID=3412748 RepID=UPI00403C182A